MGYIFISYSHKDKAYVHKLQKTLENEGFEVWIDDRIDYGTTWPKVIQKHLDDCDAFIVVMTENAYESEWVHNEVTRARRKGKPFFALLLRGDPWLSFEAIQYEDVTGEKLPKEKFYIGLGRVTLRKSEKKHLSPSRKITSKWALSFKDTFVSYYSNLKTSLRNKAQFLRGAIIVGFIVIIFWGGSLIVPKILGTNPPGTQVNLSDSLPAEITDSNNAIMHLVPAGEFIMGFAASRGDEAPVHTVYLNDYYLDKFEVTNTLYEECVNAGVCQRPSGRGAYTRNSYFGNPEFGEYPVTEIEWHMAKIYCEWRGARLPTEAEWEKAARGSDGSLYPWGNNQLETSDLGKLANTCDRNCPFSWRSSDVDDSYDYTAPVGTYIAGASPYGIMDMAGNVMEWVADWYDERYYFNSPWSNPRGPEDGQDHVLRGGSWAEIDGYYISFRSSNRMTTKKNPPGMFSSIGFRCARDATP